MSKEKAPKTFSFCVGMPWHEYEPLHLVNPESICVYAYGTEVRVGDMKEAEEFRRYVEEKIGKKTYIYKLVKIGD